MGQEFGRRSPRQFWLGLSHGVAVRCQLQPHHLKARPRLEDPGRRWLTHMAGESVFAIGRWLQIFSIQGLLVELPHGMTPGFHHSE